MSKVTNARADTAVQKVDAPTFLTPYLEGDTSGERLMHHRILPRVHPLDDGERVLKAQMEEHGAGAVILSPTNALIAKLGEPFKIVPLFFFSEFMTWRDRNDPESPRVTDRSLDEGSPLARLCRDEKRRSEAYGPLDEQTKVPKYRRSHIEYLRFACVLYDHPTLHGVACVVSYAKGNFFFGEGFTSAMTLRRVPGADGKLVMAPIWSQVWELTSEETSNGKGEWFRLAYSAPRDGSSPWIRSDEAEGFKTEHLTLREQHAKKALSVDDSADEDAEEVKTNF